MVKLTIELDDRTYYTLKALAFLREAEKLDEDPEAPRTNAADFMPPEQDAALYDALLDASLGVGQGVLLDSGA